VLAAMLIWVATAMPAAAFDLFARHQVSVQFATPDGKPMANAEVKVFAPGQPKDPVSTGHTDSDGKFEFPADRDGFWSAEARVGGEVARVSIRVGDDQPGSSEPVSPYWIVAGLLLMLIVAFAFRTARARLRRRFPPPRR
jgi:hypothetical protein